MTDTDNCGLGHDVERISCEDAARVIIASRGNPYRLRDAAQFVLGLLDAERRLPRVWLPGDTVPAGVRVVADCGGPWVNTREAVTDIPLIEVAVPRRADFAAAVAAEQARRAATDGEVGE